MRIKQFYPQHKNHSNLSTLLREISQHKILLFFPNISNCVRSADVIRK
ncbi:hypothetical protein DMA14_06165 [Flavobacterium sharifuzzamanii]|nr:hypothetical protein DMA14_06165 [Flavobacterium sharifuzzamanii]